MVTDTSKFICYPLGENAFVVQPTADSAMLPVGSNIELGRFITDSATRKQHFTVEFLDRSWQPVSSTPIDLSPNYPTPLVPPCQRATIDLRTGVSATGAVLSNGSIDPYWTLNCDVGRSDPAFVTSYGYWVNTTGNCQYITPAVFTNGSPSAMPLRVYSYCRTICAQNATTARIRLVFHSDDIVTFVKVNGATYNISLTQTAGFNGPGAIVIIPSVQLAAGQNTISVGVSNLSAITGLLLHPGSYIRTNDSSPIGFSGNQCCVPKGYIRGRKMWDKNCDGRVNGGDVTASGWTIVATRTGTTDTYSAVTDQYGEYVIYAPQGSYTVTEDMSGHPGWSPSVSAGPFGVGVYANETSVVNFLNCKQPSCEELFTVDEVDSVCCRGSFSISNAGNVRVKRISFSSTDGVVTGLTTNCATSIVPNLVGGASTGTVVFTAPCSSPNVQFDARSTTALGDLCVQWTAVFEQGGAEFTCAKTICIKCPRMPKVCNSPLQVVPSTFDPINTDWRRFILSNVKLPQSKISSVDIQFVLEPSPFLHSGGGLKVDGTSRVWTAASSNLYNQVRLQCTGAPAQPSGAAGSNTVEFNLGVDRTLGYTGNVLLKIGYCDGDTCEIIYPWLAPTHGTPPIIDTAIVMNPNIRYLLYRVQPPDSCASVQMRLGDTTAVIKALTPACGGTEKDCDDVQFQMRTEAMKNVASMVYNGYNGDSCPAFTMTMLYDTQDATNVECPLSLSFYNKRGEVLATSERTMKVLTTSVAESGNESSLIQINTIAPNPASGTSTITYTTTGASQTMSVNIVDAFGQVVATVAMQKTVYPGRHSEVINTQTLPVGKYIVRIVGDAGAASIPLVVLR